MTVFNRCRSYGRLQTLRFGNLAWVVGAVSVALSLLPPQARATTADEIASRPNIVLIMADDMGYSDIGCYGGEIHTPALDQLASDGLRFRQFYNTARCCPTRASLMTGLYPHQAGVGWMMADNGHDGYRGDLNRNCMTIAEVLREAGYGTYMSGKWHLTKHTKPEGPKDNWPRQRGFDRFYGTITGAGSFYDPATLTRENTQIAPDEPNYYYTDAITNNAVRFVQEHRKSKGQAPFFMYVAYTAPHWPMHALPEDIARYKGRFDSGWDAIRAERYMRMLKLGVIDKSSGLSGRDSGIESWPVARLKEWHIRRMEVYAAMIDRMDQGIGRIVNTLKAESVWDNTLILFLADNGGCAEEYGSTGPMTPPKPQSEFVSMKPGELQGAMRPPKTRDGAPVRIGRGVMPGPADTYIAYGKPWANVSNTPFRFYKHWVHEGGISSPLIAHWPKGLSRRGQWENQPGHLIDIMATCVELSGADYPKEYRGESIKPMEGRSLVPCFSGKTIEREALYWEHEGNRAVRVDNWKLVAAGENGSWELYDLAKDRSELKNLVEARPEIAADLAKKWEAYARRANVYPLRPYAKRNSSSFSKRKRFKLVSGANLPQSEAPMLRGKPFSMQIQVEQRKGDGVIIAQGGTADGFSLFVQNGQLRFAIRRDGELEVVKGGLNVPESFAIAFTLSEDGSVVAKVDEAPHLEGEVDGLLTAMPIDGLQVGRDLNGEVGDYAPPNALDAKIVVDLSIGKAP